MADEIRRQLDCDMLEVVPSVAYASDYHDMLDQARGELEAIRKGTYPSVGTTVKRFDDYEIVFVGYPIWFGSMATPMQAFLHLHQSGLAGKRIALFATSGSSGMSVSVGEARRLCPESEVLDQTLLLTSSALSQTENRVGAWLRAVGAERQVPAHAVRNGNHRK